jgi:hypothetical protein
MEQMAREIKPKARGNFNAGKCEVAFFTMIGKTQVKGKIDCVCDYPEGLFLFDLKTMSTGVSEGEFRMAAAKFKYFMQAALYVDIVEAVLEKPVDLFGFVCQHTTAPYETKSHQLLPEGLEKGRYYYKFALDRYESCIETGDWELNSDEIAVVALPDYIMNMELHKYGSY